MGSKNPFSRIIRERVLGNASKNIMNHETRNSLLWSFVGRFATQSINLAIFTILARILGPEVVGDAIVPIFIVGFSTICLQAIIGQTMISKNFIDKPDREVVLYVSRRLPIVMALVLSLPIWVLLGSVDTQNLLAVFIVTLLAITFSQSHYYISLFEIKADFKTVAKVEFISMLISGSLSVLISILGFKSLSLVCQVMVLQMSLSFFSKKFSSDTHLEGRDRETLKKIYSFGIPAVGSSVATFFSRNLDNLIVLKFIGKSEAGIYSRIYTLTMFPVTQLSYIVSRVYFPKLSNLKDNRKEYRQTFFRGYYLIATIILTFSSIFVLFSESIIRITLGVDWLSGSSILKMLMFSAMCQPVGATLSWLALSSGKSTILFRWNVFTTCFTLTIMIIYARNGLDALVLGYLISNMVLIFPSVLGMSYLLNEQVVPVLSRVLRPYLIFLILWFSYESLRRDTRLLIMLMVAVSAIVYFVYFFIEKFKSTNSENCGKNILFVSFSKQIWGAERSLLELGQGLASTENSIEYHLVSLNSDLSDAWKKLGPSFVSAHFDSKLKATTFLLRSVLTARYFSIVYFSLSCMIIAPLIRLLKPSLQQVLDFHDFLPRWQGRFKLKILSYSLDRIITISDFCLHSIKGTHGKKTKLYRPIYSREAKNQLILRKRTRIGVIGRIDGDKNLGKALDVLDLLPQGFSLIFRGSPLSDKTFQLDLERKAEKFGERIRFEGKVDTSSLYEGIDILLVTNTNEPMGRTVGECQLLGIPVVVPNSGGASELVRDLETGFTYNFESLESISSSLLKASRVSSRVLNQARGEAVIRHDPTEYARDYREAITSR
jgi:O-antigen/teichoic acid export membrane protein